MYVRGELENAVFICPASMCVLFALRAQKATAKMQKQITITNIEHRNALLIKKGENE